MKLTAKQDKFCQEYILDLNAGAAAVRAGYSKKSPRSSGCHLLQNVVIAARIAELLKVSAARTEITKDWVLSNLKTVAERCLQAQEVVVNGQPSGEWRFDAGNAIRALELLGKHVGIFSDRGEESCPPPVALRHFRALLGLRDADPTRN